MSHRLVSIIVNNCNYARFLPQAIDSALAQDYLRKEVLVVDDGSTDNSREVIASYADHVKPVLKMNGGQTSAFNAGFAASCGETLIFLDADDLLLPEAATQAMAQFADHDVVKVHWPLKVINEGGSATGATKPSDALPSGRLLDLLQEYGPAHAGWPPTSGNAWRRSFLQRVFPIPEVEREYNVGSASADWYLAMLAPLFGTTAAINQPLACYRVHGSNDHTCMDFDRRLARDVRMFDYRSSVLQRYCREFNVPVDPARWENNSWCHRLSSFLKELDQTITPGAPFILIDDSVLSLPRTAQRQLIPFLERDGEYWGQPSDDQQAIDELERLRAAGAKFLVIAWPSFWWLDHYGQFARHVDRSFAQIVRNDRLIVFNLDL